MHLAIITPSRGRPHNLLRLIGALDHTSMLDWSLWVGLDDDDPTIEGYATLPAHPRVNMVVEPRDTLCAKTNTLAVDAVAAGSQFLASLGDDHLPKTHGWDKQLADAILAMDGPGWAYGDDLLRGATLPTAWVQSAALVTALGWMMYPRCQHLYVDNVTYDLGHTTGRLTYLPYVVVEHCHYANGKAPQDESYTASNSSQRVREDGGAYRQWAKRQLATDAATVRALTW